MTTDICRTFCPAHQKSISRSLVAKLPTLFIMNMPYYKASVRKFNFPAMKKEWRKGITTPTENIKVMYSDLIVTI